MRVKYEDELFAAEKLAFGGFCDALGDIASGAIDQLPDLARREVQRHIRERTGRIGLDVTMDPVSIKLWFSVHGRDSKKLLYEVVGSSDAGPPLKKIGRPIQPEALKSRYARRARGA